MHKTYWWRGKDNFGDRLNGMLQMQLGLNPHWAAPADADLVIVGSILEHLPEQWGGTVCGAGLLRPESRVDLTKANVLALRGKLTAARVTGAGKVALGDPGLLVSKLIRQPLAKYELGIVPHWSDTKLRQRYPYAKLIDVSLPPDQVVAEIASCKRIIASSLHGVIVADAYGIPRQAEIFEQAANEGGDFKFRDYASVFDGDPHFGEMYRAPFHQVEKVQAGLWDALTTALDVPNEKPAPTVQQKTISWPWEPRPQISFLVPFRDDGEGRVRIWSWLSRFWTYQFRSSEVVVGQDYGTPFSKAVAVNDAASRARGRVFVILDADAFMNPRAVQQCADNIDKATRVGARLWYMPYNKLYRLNQAVTEELITHSPLAEFDIPSPPPEDWIEPGLSHDYGHQYGAMMMVMPRRAFFAAGGMDPRFRGWGSEDASFMRAVDTVYCPHELADNDILHLWHVRPGTDWKTRKWVGQTISVANSRLTQRYAAAIAEPAFMKSLASERDQPKNSWINRLMAFLAT